MTDPQERYYEQQVADSLTDFADEELDEQPDAGRIPFEPGYEGDGFTHQSDEEEAVQEASEER